MSIINMYVFQQQQPLEHLEPFQTSKMDLSVKIVKAWKPLTYFPVSSILNIWLSFE